ncbi:MAG: hypothetical protein H6739_25855 [Alphaproteobacteria bacterium]|nr:hypothetical protein [Alphaproteobacteria bacterium]
MRSLSPKVRAMVGVMTITVYAVVCATALGNDSPILAVIFGALAALRLVLLIRQWPRDEAPE